jgi:hypothetical protein
MVSTPQPPKATATSATAAHFRKLGFADDYIRLDRQPFKQED